MIAVPHYITSEEYLDIERQSSIRHEYRYGLVYAMAGGSDNHDRIGFNFLKVIDTHFGEGSECRFYSGNVKVNYQDKLYYYPDAFVTCDPRDRHDRYLKRYPKVIVEVLSASTEAFDRGEKFEDYQQLTQLVQASRLDEPRIPVALALGSVKALEEYVLISQDCQQVECRRRTATNTWEVTIYKVGDRVILNSIDLDFDIAELYRGLDS